MQTNTDSAAPAIWHVTSLLWYTGTTVHGDLQNIAWCLAAITDSAHERALWLHEDVDLALADLANSAPDTF